MKEKARYWKSRSDAFEQDKVFLQDQVLESKRKNKLLKTAIARLQEELDQKDRALKGVPAAQHGAVRVVKTNEGSQDEENTFVTSVKPQPAEGDIHSIVVNTNQANNS